MTARAWFDGFLADSARQPKHENQDFGNRLIQVRGDLIAELDIGQSARQHLVLLDRDVMLFGEFDDLGADDALALGCDPRRPCFVVVQRDRELVPDIDAHSARSRKCPARAGVACGGLPSRITMSPGCSSARLSCWLSCEAPARSCAAVAGRSAHIRTEVLSPTSEICAWIGPDGSTSIEKRARHTRLAASTSWPPPSREISNWAIAVPCGVTNGISKFQLGEVVSMRGPAISIRSGSEATCSRVCRAIAASVLSSRWCAVVASGASGAIEGDAIGCGVGTEPRNGGGGVLVWIVTSPSRMSFSEAAARAGLPSSCSASCNRFRVAPAVDPACKADASPLRPAAAVCTISSATATRACGSMISRTSSSDAEGARLDDPRLDDSRLAAAEAFGVAACAA